MKVSVTYDPVMTLYVARLADNYAFRHGQQARHCTTLNYSPPPVDPEVILLLGPL